MLINWIAEHCQINSTWFTADQHFGHANIIEFCDRPFGDVEEMDAALIDNWNSRVDKNDIVFHLGDFTLGGNVDAEHYFSQLNGRIFVLANTWHHDKRWMRVRPLDHLPMLAKGSCGPLFSKYGHNVQLYPPLCVLEVTAPPLGGEKHPLAITLCHYPLAEWDRKHYRAWHLHGHSHGKHECDGDGFRMDVGVDSTGYAPLNLGDVLDHMYNRGWA